LDRGENDDRQAPSAKILLEGERLVSGKQNVEAVLFRCIEQSAVVQSGPAHSRDGEHLMTAQQLS
jgi:hypothetical protein